MRKSFTFALGTLKEDIVAMATLSSETLDLAVKAMRAYNIELTTEVKLKDNKVDRMQLEIDKLCVEALIRQQPLAKDMRLIMAILKMSGELERIGDQAADVAHLVQRIIKRDYRYYSQENIIKMSEIAQRMLSDAIRSFVEKDLLLAAQVCAMDDEMDVLYRVVRKEIKGMMRTSTDYVDEGVTYLSIAKYFEKIGDHITNVAEWIIYTRTGHFARERQYQDDHLEE